MLDDMGGGWVGRTFCTDWRVSIVSFSPLFPRIGSMRWVSLFSSQALW